MKGVYLLHFERPYKHARHYLGYTTNLDARLANHRNGRGARLVTVITEAGIPFEVARIWPRGTRTLEKRLKGSHARFLCPICTPGTRRGSFKPQTPKKSRRRVRFTKAELKTMRRGYRDARRRLDPRPGKLYGAYMRGYRKGKEPVRHA